jgi:hypothetical protein
MAFRDPCPISRADCLLGDSSGWLFYRLSNGSPASSAALWDHSSSTAGRPSRQARPLAATASISTPRTSQSTCLMPGPRRRSIPLGPCRSSTSRCHGCWPRFHPWAAMTTISAEFVRRQSIWDKGRDRLGEGLAHRIGDLRQRAAGAGSGGGHSRNPWSLLRGTDGSNSSPSSGESATNCSGVGLRWSAESRASTPTHGALLVPAKWQT